jgi:1-deoxyxylulose-5-phosphate synthase
MEYRLLGRTGVRISPFGIGTMNFGDTTSADEAAAIINTAMAAGVNFFDTADAYNNGLSETTLGQALRGRRQEVFLATKFHFPMGSGPNDAGNSRLHIQHACEASLRRLGTDVIDLYQVHRPNPEIAIEEPLGALTDLVHAGKVRYIGCSTHPAWMVMEALNVSARDRLARFASEQPPYNLLDRRIENELVPLALKYNLALIPWAPLAMGVLAGRYLAGQPYPADARAARLPNSMYSQRVTPRGLEAGARFSQVARAFNKTPGQLALLWALSQPGITAPIYGPRTVAQLQELLPVLEMKLTADEQVACDAINPPGGVLVNFYNTADWMKTPII